MAIDLETRIQQFKQMAEADPENELGHFSLGKAYLEAKQFDEAIEPLTRATTLNAKLSKGYQLLGEAYQGAGKRDEAIKTLTNGVTIADDQGDRVPRDNMATLLKEMGAEVPTFKARSSGGDADEDATISATGFQCARCSKPTGQLPKPPFKGPVGQKVYENSCQTCWREWIEMGTKVINELGLVLAKPESQEIYDQHMLEFLMLEDR